MGKEWHWVGTKSKRSGRDKDDGLRAASGCMCAVFQLFDFHHFHFSTLHHHQQHPSIVQPTSIDSCFDGVGVGAPRNSLEESEESQGGSSFVSSAREDESLNIPMGIQIKTRRSKAASDCSSEISSSPGTKTPGLVARLMGLDLLPRDDDVSSPSNTTLNPPYLRKSNKPIPRRNSVDGSFTGTRSLPETPRISSARRSDVDLHHRFSLQNNKENGSPAEDQLVLSRISSLRRLKEERKSEENERSPGRYARQIVKQVKESVVGRKAGKDITNTVRTRPETASSPKLKNREDKLGSDHQNLPPLHVQRQRPAKEGKKVEKEKLKKPPQTSDIIRNKKEEPFVIRPTLTSNIPDKKCKKTPLSNHLLTPVPTLLRVKKDPTPPATKQVPNVAQESKRGCSQLSSCSSQPYDQEDSSTFDKNSNKEEDELNVEDEGCEAIEEYEYVTKILSNSNVSFTRWFSPSHPLDPSVFRHLENSISLSQLSGQLRHKCNRKLMFHLVDEILAGILKPWSRLRFFGRFETFKGSNLLSRLCEKIRSYPRADCRVLEDIDGIIGKDLTETTAECEMAFEEETDWIVREIEKDILDGLVRETTDRLGETTEQNGHMV